jgi:hypothetical protein
MHRDPLKGWIEEARQFGRRGAPGTAIGGVATVVGGLFMWSLELVL